MCVGETGTKIYVEPKDTVQTVANLRDGSFKIKIILWQTYVKVTQ